MSNSFILILITLFTAAQIFYSIKKNTLEGYLDDIQFFWSAMLVSATFILALVMPIKVAAKERIESPSFANYEGAAYLITGKSIREEGLKTIKVNNTNIVAYKVTFKSFFGCELIDYEVNYN